MTRPQAEVLDAAMQSILAVAMLIADQSGDVPQEDIALLKEAVADWKLAYSHAAGVVQ